MSRPTTKADLLRQAAAQYDKLTGLIAGMDKAVRAAPFSFPLTDKDKEAHWRRDQNLRDVLIHLYEWHKLLLGFVANNQGGGKPVPFLPPPYTWANYGEMNQGFFHAHQDTSLQAATALLMGSHGDVMALMEGFSQEALFTKAYFPWTGTTSLGAYCISATSSHYEWAMKKIKRQVKAVGGEGRGKLG